MVSAAGVVLATVLATVQPLPPDAGVDYQLGGAYPVPTGIGTVVRDRTEPPASGLYNVCYVNAFQTQPGEVGWWRRNHPDLLLRDRDGRPVADPGWPDERLLDHGHGNRAALVGIVTEWIDGCATAGYDAVEFDNMDSWSRSDGLLGRTSAVRYAAALADAAHDAGLAAGQKNDVENTARHRANGFDFAVSESCQRWDECGVLDRAYGDAVLEIEYRRADFDAACAGRGPRWSIVLRDRMLRPAGRPGYVFAAC